MKIAIIGTLLFVSALVSSAPTSESSEDGPLVITKKFFSDDYVRYTGEHDIVKIEVPINQLNMDDSSVEGSDEDITLFFIEGDVKENGEREYKGLYILQKKQAKKLMDNARDVTSEAGSNNNVFFAANDGLYFYNTEKKTPEKYGTITESLLEIERPNNTDIIYALNDKYELLKITDAGTKFTKIDDVKNARQMVLDLNNNLYYMDSNKDVFVVSAEGVKKIEGLPDKKTYRKLVKPLIVMDDGALIVVEDEAYQIFPNGTSSFADVKFEVRPSAYEPSPTIIQYYGYEKKIYEYNLFAILLGDFLTEIKEFLDDCVDQVKALKPFEF